MRPQLTNLKKAAKVLLLGKKGLGGSSDVAHPIQERVGQAAQGLAKEAEIGPLLHEQAMAALHRMQEMDSSLKELLDQAYGYAIFPSVARAALILGATFGKGEVFKKGDVIGYAGLVQITAGVQLGGETVHVLVLLDDEKALERLKSGKTSFAANASLGILKTGLAAVKGPYGLRVFVYPEGGGILEASIGGQTIKFRPAALGRLRSAA